MKKRTIKTLLIDAKNMDVKEIEIKDDLHEFYRVLDCDTIDIVNRPIGGKNFDIMLDDEGRLKPNCIISGVSCNPRFSETLVGNLMIFRTSRNGGLVSLREEDVDHVKKNIKRYGDTSFGTLKLRPYVVIWGDKSSTV